MKYINLNEPKILEIQNCRESFRKWIKNFKELPAQNQHEKNSSSESQNNGKENFQKQSEEVQKQVEQYFDKYLKTVKPVIGNFISLTQSLDSKGYAFYSDILSKQQISKLQQLFEPIKKFTTLSRQEINKNQSFLTKQQVDQLTKKSKPITKMDLKSPPENQEYEYWGSTLPIEKFTIQGTVKKGKGLGSEGLGMPTANIQIPITMNKLLQPYPNGIYITTVTFANIHPSEIYIGATSLGTNPHYENSTSNRILETYILNDFKGENFYGETLLTEFHELIRPEFKFRDFSSFLHGMRDDIEVAKDWGKRLKGKEQLFCSE